MDKSYNRWWQYWKWYISTPWENQVDKDLAALDIFNWRGIADSAISAPAISSSLDTYFVRTNNNMKKK